MFGKLIMIATIVAATVLAYVVQVTSPHESGPAIILAVFFLLYILLTGILTGGIRGVNQIVVKISSKLITRQPIEHISLRRAYYFASVAALGPVMLLAMGSVGKMGLNEFLLVTAFVLIGLFYIQKRSE